MKKALLVLVALCMAGVFSAKAQSPSDSAYARDLSYTFINTGSLPNSVSGTLNLSSGSKILKDIRTGKRANGYAITVPANTYLDLQLTSGGWDSYLYLLDSTFNEVDYNDDWYGMGSSYGSRITTQVTAGQYFVLVSEYSYATSARSYTLTVDTINVTPFNQLTFTQKTLPFSIHDTFTTADPNVLIYGNVVHARGYSFQGTQGKFLMLDSISNINGGILLDNNYNEIVLNGGVALRLPYTGTYYFVLGHNTVPTPFSLYAEQIDLPTIYVDGVNGSDSRNGLTPQTAVFTLDTAIARTRGIGKYLITDDYTFRNNDPLYVSYAEIYPYQKDIKLKIASNDYDDIFIIYGTMIFGENGSNYSFILDSNSNQDYYDFLDADAYGSYLEVNNLKVRNTHFPSLVFWGDQVVLRNCEFINNTINEEFIGLETASGNSVKFIDCNISQNFIYSLIYQDYDSMKVTFENTTVTGNTFDYPLVAWGNAEVNLTSGSWSGNTLSSDYGGNGNPNISRQTAAGIWAMSSTVNFGAGFSMDANNFLCIDTASILNVNQNITASSAATVYPWKIDPSTNKAVADYYEGRTLLSGSAVAANYRKFSVAQADNSTLWYLHPDGTIHTYPVGIDQAEEGTISIYPNPASDVLNIALQGTEVNEVAVIDIYGKTVARTNVSEGSNTLDISTLPAGMYFVQLRAAGSVKATQKIVKR